MASSLAAPRKPNERLVEARLLCPVELVIGPLERRAEACQDKVIAWLISDTLLLNEE